MFVNVTDRKIATALTRIATKRARAIQPKLDRVGNQLTIKESRGGSTKVALQNNIVKRSTTTFFR